MYLQVPMGLRDTNVVAGTGWDITEGEAIPQAVSLTCTIT
jgi:hypothetical protein